MGNTLAEKFKQIRTDAGDTAAAAAEKVGISRQGYIKWENGNTKNMTLNNLLIFCEKYKVEVEPLIRCARGDGSLQYSTTPLSSVQTASEPPAASVVAFPNPLLVELQNIAAKISPAGLNRLIERASQLAEDYPSESLGKDASSH